MNEQIPQVSDVMYFWWYDFWSERTDWNNHTCMHTHGKSVLKKTDRSPCFITVPEFGLHDLLILVIILWDQFCRNWLLFSHSPPNSPTMSCSWHQPRSCVFYVKCSIMLNTLSYLWALFMMRRVNDFYSSFFFPVQCYIISVLYRAH